MSTDNNSSELEKVCTTLDKLVLDSLTLMEQQIQTKIDLESAMTEGESNLSKARYIMGVRNVSSLQLPGEDATEFKALAVLNSEENSDVIETDRYDLEMRKKDELGDEYQDPLRWFGVLVPQNLHSAQRYFRSAVGRAVQSANVQVRLAETMDAIERLRSRKAELVEASK